MNQENGASHVSAPFQVRAKRNIEQELKAEDRQQNLITNPKSKPKSILKPRAKAVPIRVHRLVRTRQPVCGKCQSNWFLQTDHKKSKWAGGTNEFANLQTLCGACNRRKYFLESGVKRLVNGSVEIGNES